MADYRRFFADKSCLNGNQITLCGEEYKHLANVLRMRVGDNCFVCFNDGIDHFCQIDAIDKTCAHISILNSWQTECENPFTTTLYMAVTKGDKNDTIVQKAVELGVNKIVFFESRYSVSKIDEKKAQRLSKISIEASKQCGRAVIVPVQVASIKQVAAELASYDVALFCYEKAQDVSLSTAVGNAKNIALIVGSEGGFADEEIALAQENGITPITLGKRILRTETAGMTTTAILLYELD
jgi:16S rRNA (uracil1498-N3)-methyltransferase